MADSQISDEQIREIYHVILLCHKHGDNGRPQHLKDYTERSLASVHQDLKKRGLLRNPKDNTEPDEFAGYSSIEVRGVALKFLFCQEAFAAFLYLAWTARVDKASRDAIMPMIREFRSRFIEKHLPIDFDNDSEVRTLSEELQNAVDAYHASGD